MAVISTKNLLEVMHRVEPIKGDFAEIGVFRGDTFKRLSLLGWAMGRVSHGFDSFEGMAPNTDRDGGHYPQGKLSVGGEANFVKIMNVGRVPSEAYRLYRGWIPSCLDAYSDEKPFAFGLVDVDQYDPTLAALEWIWPRLAYGGILLLDDYFPGRSILASAAIDAWLASVHPSTVQVLRYEETQLYVQKVPISAIGSTYAKMLLRD